MSDEKYDEVAENLVVSIDYVLTVEGEEIDSSKEEGPLEYLHGFANIISGLEKELAGMKVNDSKQVDIAPEEAYGLVDEEAIISVPVEEFPEDVPLEPGIELEITDQDGDMMFATIVKVGKKNVKLDTNHPLAGKTLHFDVSVVSIRPATEEELDHGHVHYGHDHEH